MRRFGDYGGDDVPPRILGSFLPWRLRPAFVQS
jgi:hypothetical protein